MQHEEPERLHPQHEDVAHGPVPDDDEGEREERNPADVLDALEGNDVAARVVKKRGVNREGDRRPTQDVFPKTAALLRQKTRRKRQITKIRADELDQRDARRRTYSENHRESLHF